MYVLFKCNLRAGHLENIHAETCIDFLILLIEIFGEFPEKEMLSGKNAVLPNVIFSSFYLLMLGFLFYRSLY